MEKENLSSVEEIENVGSQDENSELLKKRKVSKKEDKQSILNNPVYARFCRHYMYLFPITGESLTKFEKAFISKIYSSQSSKETSKLLKNNFRVLCSTRDVTKQCFIFMLTLLPILTEIKFITLSDILDIQFDKTNIAKNIKEIHAPLILLYIDNVTNKLKSEYLMRALEFWTRKGSSVWIFYKNTKTCFMNEYGSLNDSDNTVINFLASQNCSIIELNNDKSQVFQYSQSVKVWKQKKLEISVD